MLKFQNFDIEAVVHLPKLRDSHSENFDFSPQAVIENFQLLEIGCITTLFQPLGLNNLQLVLKNILNIMLS